MPDSTVSYLPLGEAALAERIRVRSLYRLRAEGLRRFYRRPASRRTYLDPAELKQALALRPVRAVSPA